MCVISALSATAGITAAISSSIASAASATAAAVGGTMAAGTAATIGSVGAAGLVGAAEGAAFGAITSAATGGKAGKGALIGTGIGGVGGMAVEGGKIAFASSGLYDKTLAAQSGVKMMTGAQQGATESVGMLNEGAEVSKLARESGTPVADKASGQLLSNADKALIIEKAGGALGQTVQAGVSGYGQVEQAKLNQKSLDDQAKMEKIRAQQALDRAAVEKMDNARKTRQLIGKGKVAAAANGVMLESRAESLASMWEQDANAELAYDNAKIDYNAQLEAWGYRENARRLRQQGRLGVRTARRGAVAGTLTAAGIGLGNVALSGFTIGMKNGWWDSTAAMAKSPASTSAVDWNIPGYHSRTSAMNFA